MQAIRANRADNVATALEALPAGASVQVEGAKIRIRDDVPVGHKFALADLDQGEPVIRKIVRISKPGLRQYTKAGDLRSVVNGQGVAIVSTSKGVMADRQCRSEGIGGELLCEVW